MKLEWRHQKVSASSWGATRIGAICSRHKLLYHCYADDTQVYLAIMSKTTCSDVAKKLEACSTDISTWISANILKLNEEKAELIIFDTKHQVGINEELRLQVGRNTVSVASSAKNLGIYLDTSLTMDRQVNAISKACYYQIRNIGHIRRYITLDTCETLAHALITSRLDYNNALLYGLPSTLMTRQQKKYIILLPG